MGRVQLLRLLSQIIAHDMREERQSVFDLLTCVCVCVCVRNRQQRVLMEQVGLKPQTDPGLSQGERTNESGMRGEEIEEMNL